MIRRRIIDGTCSEKILSVKVSIGDDPGIGTKMAVLNTDAISIYTVSGPSYNASGTGICRFGTDSDIGTCILKVAAVDNSCDTSGIDIIGNNGRNASIFAYYRN